MIKFIINDAVREVDADPDRPLPWVIRNMLEMTGTKFGCGAALVDRAPCTLTVSRFACARRRSLPWPEGKVTTIQGISGKAARAMQAAWTKLDVVQCGYCQSAQIMGAARVHPAAYIGRDH
jgi:isoquinoline 1-oxidoreductase alpha subunit